jgi:hypothetical protein
VQLISSFNLASPSIAEEIGLRQKETIQIRDIGQFAELVPVALPGNSVPSPLEIWSAESVKQFGLAVVGVILWAWISKI